MTVLSRGAGSVFDWLKKDWQKKPTKTPKKVVIGSVLFSLLFAAAMIAYSGVVATSAIYAEYALFMQKQSMVAPTEQGTVSKVDSFNTSSLWKYLNTINLTKMRIDGGTLHTSSGKVFNFLVAGMTKDKMAKARIFTIPVKMDGNDPVLNGQMKNGTMILFADTHVALRHFKICFDVNSSVICGLGVEKSA